MFHVAADGLIAVEPVDGEHRENREIRDHDGPVEELQMVNALEGIVEQDIGDPAAERGDSGSQQERGYRHQCCHLKSGSVFAYCTGRLTEP
jgi:hypothetical protein